MATFIHFVAISSVIFLVGNLASTSAQGPFIAHLRPVPGPRYPVAPAYPHQQLPHANGNYHPPEYYDFQYQQQQQWANSNYRPVIIPIRPAPAPPVYQAPPKPVDFEEWPFNRVTSRQTRPTQAPTKTTTTAAPVVTSTQNYWTADNNNYYQTQATAVDNSYYQPQATVVDNNYYQTQATAVYNSYAPVNVGSNTQLSNAGEFATPSWVPYVSNSPVSGTTRMSGGWDYQPSMGSFSEPAWSSSNTTSSTSAPVDNSSASNVSSTSEPVTNSTVANSNSSTLATVGNSNVSNVSSSSEPVTISTASTSTNATVVSTDNSRVSNVSSTSEPVKNSTTVNSNSSSLVPIGDSNASNAVTMSTVSNTTSSTVAAVNNSTTLTPVTNSTTSNTNGTSSSNSSQALRSFVKRSSDPMEDLGAAFHMLNSLSNGTLEHVVSTLLDFAGNVSAEFENTTHSLNLTDFMNPWNVNHTVVNIIIHTSSNQSNHSRHSLKSFPKHHNLLFEFEHANNETNGTLAQKLWEDFGNFTSDINSTGNSNRTIFKALFKHHDPRLEFEHANNATNGTLGLAGSHAVQGIRNVTWTVANSTFVPSFNLTSVVMTTTHSMTTTARNSTGH